MEDLMKSIQINSVKEAEEILLNADRERVFKAHKDGDLHPNGKWYWKASANGGKGDWRVIKKTTSSKSVSTTSNGVNKTSKLVNKVKVTNKSVNNFTINELKDDENTLHNSPDTKTKKTLAAKYGVNSMKADDIRKKVLEKLNEFHKTKKTFDDEDVKWFNEYWDYPSSPQKLRLAFKDESDEFLEHYIKVEEARYNAMPASQRYHSIIGRSIEREIKALKNIVNDRKNENDSELKDLIKNLNKETKVFHDDYINRTEKYHSQYFDNLEQMKDFKMYDFMSFFGVMSNSRHDYIAEQMKKRYWGSLKSSEMDIWYKFHSDRSKAFSSKTKSITIWGQNIQPKEIRVAASIYSGDGENIHSDLPSKQALDYANGVSMMKSRFDFNKKKYVTHMKVDAEKRYQSNMMIVADKVRQMHMNERNLKVKSIKTSVKGFDIVITDGDKKIYARSIYAAENSVLVAPHFRFIVTDRSNVKGI